MKKIVLFILTYFVISFTFPNVSCSANSQVNDNKTIIIVVDELDFKVVNKLLEKNTYSVGIMNVKTDNLYDVANKESLFMTIAKGRRVTVRSGLYKGKIKLADECLYVEGYENIKKNVENVYGIKTNVTPSIAEVLKTNNIKMGYVGSGYSVLIACDDSGRIEHGLNYLEYDYNWIQQTINKILNKVDIIVMEYKINNDKFRMKILSKIIENQNDKTIIIFPHNISKKLNVNYNKTLVPLILINNNTKGLVYSDTTKREGIITSFDIYPTLLKQYNIKSIDTVGNIINVTNSNDVINKIEKVFDNAVKLNLLKYLFYGIIIILQLYCFITIKLYDIENLNQKKRIFDSIILLFLASLIFSFFNYNNLLIYCLLLVLFMIGKMILLNKIQIDNIIIISIFTNLLILYGIFFNRTIIYNSFLGYNNILSGGRFYGFNNAIAGVFLATSVILYFEFDKQINNKNVSFLILVIYYLIIINSMSNKFGSNFGGYVTSVILLIIIVFINYLNKEISFKSVIFILSLIIVLVAINKFVLKISILDISHVKSLITRIQKIGYNEFLHVAIKKVKQFIFMLVIPPWNVLLLSQLLYIYKLYNNEKRTYYRLTRKCRFELDIITILIILSITSFLINDTGIVQSTFINTYTIDYLLKKRM